MFKHLKVDNYYNNNKLMNTLFATTNNVIRTLNKAIGKML